ncbi:Uncharacterised protein [Bordetella pertussis]|nr:Uncharacterised protein [Bordetella pertussis]
MSVGPPAANGTTMFTGRSGYSARAVSAPVRATAANRAESLREMGGMRSPMQLVWLRLIRAGLAFLVMSDGR